MLLFRIFIHRSNLIFHFTNAFIFHLFSSPLGALHIQMNKYQFTPGSLLSLNSRPLTFPFPPSYLLWILLSWTFLVPNLICRPRLTTLSPTSVSLLCALKNARKSFCFDFKSKHKKSFTNSVSASCSRVKVVKRVCSSQVWFWPQDFFFFFFLGPCLQHMEVSRLEIGSELQLLACATAMTTQDLSCNLHHSSQQHRILNTLSEVRDWTHILMNTSQVGYPWDATGNSSRVCKQHFVHWTRLNWSAWMAKKKISPYI